MEKVKLLNGIWPVACSSVRVYLCVLVHVPPGSLLNSVWSLAKCRLLETNKSALTLALSLFHTSMIQADYFYFLSFNSHS